MNTNTMRRPYAAPSAELICFVPDVPVASWIWQGGSTSDISNGVNHWGIKGLQASVTGVIRWLDGNEENPDLK